MNLLARVFPWAVLFAALVLLLTAMTPPSDPDNKIHLVEAGRLPVLHQGRVKPLDSLARTTLMKISSRQEYRDENGNVQPAIRWLFEVAAPQSEHRTFLSEERLAFRIENDWLRNLLHLPARRDALYSFREIRRHFDQLEPEVKRVVHVPPGKRSEDDTSLWSLVSQIEQYLQYRPYETPFKVFRIENDQVLNLLLLEPRPGSYRYSSGEFLPRMGILHQEYQRAAKLKEGERSLLDAKVVELLTKVEHYIRLADLNTETLFVVPPSEEGQPWKTYAEASKDGQKPALARLLEAFRIENPDEFNKPLAEYRSDLEQRMPEVLKRVSFEAFFNSASPFWYCIWLYVGVFLLACLSWLTWGEPLRRAAFWLLVLALLLQTFGMLGRMYLMQRPLVFVTNLYATAVFIGWMGALAGLGLELVYRKGIGAAVAGLVAFLTAIVGHFLDLAADGDTVGNLQAVLDTNFWLATHVTTVNIGYAAVLVAGCLGIGLILVGLFTSTLDRDLYRMLGQMMYGVLCFATFFSFVGTVTGGIWGDVSWGRFWGWDPKENGALLIVLMCALILHARWGGMIQPRGMAVLAVLGNVVTLWSWFGVNMLGVGLHSYGFMEKGFWWWLAAVLIHLMVALLGLLPLSLWRSYDAVQVDDPGSRYACRFPSPAANTASTETAKPVSSSELAVVPGPHSPKTR